MALDPPMGRRPAKTVWRETVGGTPSSMIAADGKLFVVTREGALYCFGSQARQAATHSAKAVALAGGADRWAAVAADTLRLSGASEGYAVVLGIDNGRLIEELLGKSELHVIGIDANAEKIEALRRKYVASGLYGKRVHLVERDAFKMRLPLYLADLVVSERHDAVSVMKAVKAERFYEVLRPYGGATCLAAGQADRERFGKWIGSGRLEKAELKYSKGFAVLRRRGPLNGSAAWTHETGDAARSYYSTDRRVKLPLGVLWYGEGVDYGFYTPRGYGLGVKPQANGGRLFALRTGDFRHYARTASQFTLFAVDIYTGRHLWKRRTSKFARYASMDDGVYVVDGDRLVVYDPATGKTLMEKKYGPKGRQFVGREIRVDGDVAVVGASTQTGSAIHKGLWDSEILVALERKTGRILWRKTAGARFNSNALAVADGKVFCVDSPSPGEASKYRRRGGGARTAVSVIMALDARSGNMLWSFRYEGAYRLYGPNSWLGQRGRDDWVAYSPHEKVLLAGKNADAIALDPDTGEKLWQTKLEGAQPMMVHGKTFMDQKGAIYDIHSGEVSEKSLPFDIGGCNYAVGCTNFVLVRHQTASFLDRASGEQHHLLNARSGCSNSYVAADGVLSIPNFAVGCVCNYPVQSSVTLVHMPEMAKWTFPESLVVKRPDIRKSNGGKSRVNVPTLTIAPRQAAITIDGRENKSEWQGVATTQLLKTPDGQKTPYDSRIRVTYDEKFLYVLMVNRVEDEKQLRAVGSEWPQDDGAEVCLQNISGKGPGPVLVIRGFASGRSMGATDAGASIGMARRVSRGTKFAASIGPGIWSAEWRISFAACGINPAKHKRLRFNVGVRRARQRKWIVWVATGGSTYELARAGELILSSGK